MPRTDSRKWSLGGDLDNFTLPKRRHPFRRRGVDFPLFVFKLGLLWLAKSVTRELRGKNQTITGKPVHLISPYKHLLNSVLFDFSQKLSQVW